MIKACECLGA